MATEEVVVPNCQGCLKSIEEGAVVAFGDSLFHVSCFVCAKCKECVNDQTNLLLLDDGRPVCDNCSYNCAACQKVIRDEAIMTGDKAYHSNCFQCIRCKEEIEDLIFTQTAKGIYCTKCYELRKAEKAQKKKMSLKSVSDDTEPVKSQSSTEESPETEESTAIEKSNNKTPSSPTSSASSASPPSLPTPVRSRSNSMKKTDSTASTMTDSFLSDISPLTLSFFDNDSVELANLSNSLGINLSLSLNESTLSGPKAKPIDTTQSRINRASEILQTSLRKSSLRYSKATRNNTGSNNVATTAKINESPNDDSKLKQELAECKSTLKELESSYSVLQEASEQALEEFNQAKGDYIRELSAHKQQEYAIVSLLKKNGSASSRKDIEKIASLRVQLERTCTDLIKHRDKLSVEIDQHAEKQTISMYYADYQESLQSQTKSLVMERDLLLTETRELKVTRDEIINEMVMLNTKNAELTTMNNDLSRRAFEKEDSGPSFSSPPLTVSPSPSTDSNNASIMLQGAMTRPRRPSDASSIMCNVSSRNSFVKDQTPTLFRIKKKGSTMFGKLTSSSSSNKSIKPEPSISSSSASIRGLSSKSIYSNHTYNSSLQSLSMSQESFISKPNTIKHQKSFMDSSPSLLSLHHQQHPSITSLNGHSFQNIFFLKKVKCGVCSEKIWSRYEYKCDGCGFVSHSRCLAKVNPECLASTHGNGFMASSADNLSVINGTLTHSNSSYALDKPLPPRKSLSAPTMFGIDLSGHALQEKRSVPMIVETCIRAVEKRGLDYEGIYRKSGGAAQVRAILHAFDNDKKIDLCDEEKFNDVCAITSVLKQYFRELPTPLFTYEHYDRFIEIADMKCDDDEKIAAFKEQLSKLPKAHYETLVVLIEHLVKIHKEEDTNRMSIKNLAMVFAPTLMRHRDSSKDFIDINYKNTVIEYLLMHNSEILTK